MRDAGAFDDLYRSTSQRLLRYSYALTGDLTEAQDVAQETYVAPGGTGDGSRAILPPRPGCGSQRRGWRPTGTVGLPVSGER